MPEVKAQPWNQSRTSKLFSAFFSLQLLFPQMNCPDGAELPAMKFSGKPFPTNTSFSVLQRMPTCAAVNSTALSVVYHSTELMAKALQVTLPSLYLERSARQYSLNNLS